MANDVNNSVNDKQENLNLLRLPVAEAVNKPAIRPNAIDWSDVEWVVKKNPDENANKCNLPQEADLLSSELALDKRGKFFEAKMKLTRVMISDYCVNLNPISQELLTSKPSDFDPSYPDEIDFFSNNPHKYFQQFKSEIEGLHEDDIKEDLQNSCKRIQEFSNVTENISVPLQLHLGIMLNVYKEKLKEKKQNKQFLEVLNQTFGIKKQSAYNYMNAAMVVDYVNDPEVYTLSLTALYALYKLYRNGALKNINTNSIINLFINITSYTFNPDLDNFSLAANYVIYMNEYLKNFDQQKEYIADLYRSGFEWKKADRDFILKRGKNNKQFLNEYMRLLLENNINRKSVKQLLIGKNPAPIALGTSAVSTNKSNSDDSKPLSLQFIIGHGTETLLAYKQGKKTLTKSEQGKLRKLADDIYSLLGPQK